MAKKKVILLGAAGMAGHVMFYTLKESDEYEVVPVVYRNRISDESIVIDVSDRELVTSLIKSQKPDYVINCIGILIKGSLQSPDNAIFLNAYFPHLLARLCDEVGAKLIHISTDCVFSGKRGKYLETDMRDADDVYGKSKALGEVVSGRHLTIRTSIIGPEIKKDGEGLFHWFMQQNGKINGFVNAFWGGITTVQLARSVSTILPQDDLTGLVHVTNGNSISKYDLLTLFKKIWNRDQVLVQKFEGKAVDKSLSLSEHFNFNVSGYEEMLREQKNWMSNHRELYPHYE